MAVVLRLEPTDVLYRIKRGLSAYVSYLAACEMNAVFSEYLLYEPVLRILMSREYSVRCEYECPGINHSQKGDRKRLDFFAVRKAIERNQRSARLSAVTGPWSPEHSLHCIKIGRTIRFSEKQLAQVIRRRSYD